MARIRTGPAHLCVVAALSIVLAGCGGGATWGDRPPVPQPPTQVIGGIPVVTLCENLPDLTEADVAYLVGRAEKEMEGLRVRQIVHSRSHPSETRYVALQFEYHETHARIRRSRSIMIRWDETRQGRAGRGHWRRDADRPPAEDAEICAPGRSFLGEQPVPVTDVVRVSLACVLTSDEIVQLVDAVYDHVPAGETLHRIWQRDESTLEVMTGVVGKGRSLSGSIFSVRRCPGGWSVTASGEWVS